MALLFMDGFDHYDSGNDTERARRYGELYPSAATVEITGRGGVGNAISLKSTLHKIEKSFTGSKEIVIGFGFNAVALPAGSTDICILYNGSTELFKLKLLSAGTFEVFRQFTSMGVTTESVAANAWNYLEFKVDLGSNATDGSFDLRLNGVSALSDTGVDTNNGAVYLTTSVRLGCASTAGTAYDDLVILNTTGDAPTDFIGDVSVRALVPDGDAVPNEFTATGTGTTNADRVSSLTIDDDTTYLSSETASDEERFTLSAISGDVGVIHGVQVTSMARKEGAGARTARNRLTSNTTTESGDTVGLGDDYAFIDTVWGLNPDTVTAWTETTVNALESGFEIVA